MGIVSNILGRGTERRSTLANPDAWLLRGFGAVDTASGVYVTEETALRCTAVLGCLRILGETVGSLPLKVYRKRPNGGADVADDHALYGVLHDQINADWTSQEWRERLMQDVCANGNTYWRQEMDGRGNVAKLYHLPPLRVEPKRLTSGEKVYEYTPTNGKAEILTTNEVMQIPFFGYDGLKGLSPIGVAREAVALSQASEEFNARFFKNNARPGAYIKHPASLSKKAQDNLRESWERLHKGLQGAHSLGVLEEGMSLETVGIPMKDMAFIEQRKFQVSEIARLYRVPLHMLQELDQSTNNNIEHQSIEFVVHSIRPWLTKIEQRISMSLLGAIERQRFFVRFNVDALLRGDAKSRAEALAIKRQNGIINADEWRELDEMNPIGGKAGTEYLVNGTMTPAEQAGAAYKQQPAAGGLQ